MEKSKKTIVLSIIAVVTLTLLVVGATYAYFKAQTGAGSQANVKVTTYTTDLLTFSMGDNITLNISQSNFASGTGNQIGNTYAKAMLTANNKTNSATAHYYVYLNVSNNTFEYSINESTPELILTVTDNAGTEVTDISGLKHVSVKDAKGVTISGYDVTTSRGLLTLFNNKEITATPSKEEQWNIKLTFVNYDADQTKNAGKTFNAKAMIQKEKIVQTVANICKNGQSLNSCIVAMNGIDDTLYYHDASLTNGAGDNSYRYAGANPNNYVCFGSSESPCPTDNLYRIIGVFGDKVKLIKYDYATSNLLGTDGDYKGTGTPNATYYKGNLVTINTYSWNYKNDTSINSGYGSNEWSTSLFNKINLNTNYLNNIGTTWANVIENTAWKVSGHNKVSVTPRAMFTAEITNATKTYGPSDGTSKIGLMYASDYGFAASPSAWTTTLYNYDSSTVGAVNWMYMGFNEWTMTPISSSSSYVFYESFSGYAVSNNANFGNGARPVLYLKASVAYAGGSGTKDSPITLKV